MWGAQALHTPTVRWSVRTPPHGSLPCTSSHRCGEQLFDAESVDGHQVHMSNAQARACTYTWTTRLIRPPQVLRQEEKDAKSAAQLHLLHSCLGTPTEQVGVLYSFAVTPILTDFIPYHSL